MIHLEQTRQARIRRWPSNTEVKEQFMKRVTRAIYLASLEDHSVKGHSVPGSVQRTLVSRHLITSKTSYQTDRPCLHG